MIQYNNLDANKHTRKKYIKRNITNNIVIGNIVFTVTRDERSKLYRVFCDIVGVYHAFSDLFVINLVLFELGLCTFGHTMGQP